MSYLIKITPCSSSRMLFRMFIVVLIIAGSAQGTKAQDSRLYIDLLQGYWMFNRLDALVNIDMEAKTGPHNPWNINFTIKGDTCTMKRLVARSPEYNYRYDSNRYLVKVQYGQLLFFTIDKPKRKPLYVLDIVSLKNQTLKFEEPGYENIKPSLLFRTAKLTYTFARYQSPGQGPNMPQLALKGKWFIDYDFFWAVLHSGDSLKLSSTSKYYSKELSAHGEFTDTILRYKTITISDDNLVYDDSVDIRPGSNTYGYGSLPHIFDGLEQPSYYIVPHKQLVAIVIPQKTAQKNKWGFPVYEYKSTLFAYRIHDDELILIRANY